MATRVELEYRTASELTRCAAAPNSVVPKESARCILNQAAEGTPAIRSASAAPAKSVVPYNFPSLPRSEVPAWWPPSALPVNRWRIVSWPFRSILKSIPHPSPWQLDVPRRLSSQIDSLAGRVQATIRVVPIGEAAGKSIEHRLVVGARRRQHPKRTGKGQNPVPRRGAHRAGRSIFAFQCAGGASRLSWRPKRSVRRRPNSVAAMTVHSSSEMERRS